MVPVHMYLLSNYHKMTFIQLLKVSITTFFVILFKFYCVNFKPFDFRYCLKRNLFQSLEFMKVLNFANLKVIKCVDYFYLLFF